MKKEDITKKLESDKGDTDYILRSQDEEKTFLDNYGKSVLERELDPAISKIHTQYDDDLFEIFGKRKKPGEKTYKFMKDEFKSWKERAERVESLESEIAELKKGKPDDAKLQEIKDLQKELGRVKQEHQAEIQNVRRENMELLIKKDVQKAVANIKRKPGIPDEIWDTYIDKIAADLVKNAEIRDGKTVFLDANKTALRNKATMAEYTAEEIVLERLPKDVIDTGRQPVKGPGIVDHPLVKDDKGNLKTNFILPGDIKDKGQLGEYLVKELGIKRNSKEYMAAYAELSPALPMPK